MAKKIVNLCFPKLKSVYSSGLLLGDNPFSTYLPLLMTQIIFIVVISRGLHFALRPLGQSMMVSQILTGILLGPSVLGRVGFFQELYNPTNTIILKILGIVGLVFFQFIIGLKIDVGMLKKSGKKAVSIGVTGHIFPVIFAAIAYLLLKKHIAGVSFDKLNLFYQLKLLNVWTWSMSSIIVVAYLLDEVNLLNSKIGRLAIAASLIETAIDAVYRRIVAVIFISKLVVNRSLAVGSLFSFIGYILAVLFVARPFVKRMVKATPEGQPLEENQFVYIIILVLGFGLVSILIGHDVSIGVFFLGLALPSGPPLGSTLVDRLEWVTSTLCFPVLISMIGFMVDFSQFFFFVKDLSTLLFFDFVGLLGKTVGVMFAGFFCGMSVRNVVTLVIIMNAMGITELIHLRHWQDTSSLDISYYTVILFQITTMVVVTKPMLKFMYDPSKRYKRHRRRSVMNSKNNVELRVISCIHMQDQVPPAVSLLEALCLDARHPFCIYLLHLKQLVGRVTSVLLPYRKKKSSFSTPATDTIVNAFWTFEQKKNPRSVTVQPYVNEAPYTSMYDDICDLALDKKALMILLPFHKTKINATVESTREDFREVNLSVLRCAPCSVAILVDQGLITDIGVALVNLVTNVVVYFFGGSDDREALAVAMRMAFNPRMGVTVVHFKQQGEEVVDEADEKLNNGIIEQFTETFKERNNVVYRVEEVEDGEEMVTNIRMTSNTFDLIIVGRRDGQMSSLTYGMEMWSEHPELGVIGDMLASDDLGCQVPILVVQQQPAETNIYITPKVE